MIAPTVSDIFKKTAKSLFYVDIRHCSNSFRQKGYVVTVLDAYCKIGRYIALLLKQNPFIGELRLYDKNNNICAVAEDLSHIDTRTKIKSFGGKAVLKHAITDADIVVAVGGCKESHKETAKQVGKLKRYQNQNPSIIEIKSKQKIVFAFSKSDFQLIQNGGLVLTASDASSQLILVMFDGVQVRAASGPPQSGDIEYKKAGLYDSRKIIGITNVTSMRANSQVAAATGRGASEIVCPVVGGSSTNCVVAVLSQVRPKELDLKCPGSVQQLIGNSEDDVLKLYADCGTVCLSPALAVSRFINTLLKAFKGETNCVECAFVRQTGHIGQFLPYMTSIVRLGTTI
nr:uncharacterized protein LOC111510802 [Leptinotarsa decemlineata]